MCYALNQGFPCPIILRAVIKLGQSQTHHLSSYQVGGEVEAEAAHLCSLQIFHLKEGWGRTIVFGLSVGSHS